MHMQISKCIEYNNSILICWLYVQSHSLWIDDHFPGDAELQLRNIYVNHMLTDAFRTLLSFAFLNIAILLLVIEFP